MADWYCDKLNGSDTTGDGSSGNPYETIQKCVDVAADNDVIRMKGTASYTEKVTITDKSLRLIGYNTSIDDEGLATIDGESTRANCLEFTNSAVAIPGLELRNIEAKNATSHGLYFHRTTGGANSDFRLDNLHTHDNGGSGIQWDWNNTGNSRVCNITRLHSNNNTGDGIDITDGTIAIVGSKIVNNAGIGVDCAGRGAFIAESTVAKNSKNIEGVFTLVNVTTDAADGTHNWNQGDGFSVAWKCGFTNAAGYGINPTTPAVYLDLFACGFYNNTSGDINGTPNKNIDPVTGSDPLYADAANFDFMLGSSSPWKQQDLVVGSPAVDNDLSYGDIGAMQINVTGGGGGIVANRGILTGGRL